MNNGGGSRPTATASTQPACRRGESSIRVKLEKRIRRRVEVLYRQAERHYARSFPRPTIRFDVKGRVGGDACPELNQLRFNPVLLAENYDSYRYDVAPHEVAHLIAPQVHGYDVKPHGREWKAVMREAFHVEPTRCHSMDISRAVQNPHVYHCDCPGEKGTHRMSARKHNAIAVGGARRLCARCRANLRYSHDEQTPPPRRLDHIDVLLLAADADLCDAKDLARRLNGVLLGRRPKKVVLANAQRRGSAVARWLVDTGIAVERRYEYDFASDPNGVLGRVTHAVVITSGANPRIREVFGAAARARIPLRRISRPDGTSPGSGSRT